MAEEFTDEEIFTLTDEDGVEKEFELLGSIESEGQTYFALVPMEDNANNEYVILKFGKDEDGEDVLMTIDDDDEFDKVADLFDNELFGEVDYDS